jgi:hypothetical protein
LRSRPKTRKAVEQREQFEEIRSFVEGRESLPKLPGKENIGWVRREWWRARRRKSCGNEKRE